MHVAKYFACQSLLVKKIAPASALERVPRRLDQRFHVGQIPGELAAAHRRESILGARAPTVERLGAGDVPGFLELARVHAQVAVRRLQQRLDLVEGERLGGRERAHDAEADAVVDEIVEAPGAPRDAAPRPRPRGPDPQLLSL